MQALLEPLAKLRAYEADGQGFERLALLEESKSLPWNAVWDMFLPEKRRTGGRGVHRRRPALQKTEAASETIQPCPESY